MNLYKKKLCHCIERIVAGPWRFIQLRGKPLGPESLDAGDIDLLGTRDSVMLLLDAVYDWVQQGQCHARLMVRSDDKYKLLLYSCDGQHLLDLDLWIELKQLFGRSTRLVLEPLWTMCTDESPAIARLPPDLEMAIYIQHIISKRRPLDLTPVMRERFEKYQAALAADAMGAVVRTVLVQGRISPELVACSEALLRTMPTLWQRSRRHRPLRRLSRQLLAPPRRPSWIAIMGGDGTGKTALSEELHRRHPHSYQRLFVGKHLYRKTLPYKILITFVRPLLPHHRDDFDELAAPLVYLLASMRLRWKLWCTPRGTKVLMGRTLPDFIMCARKSDTPSFGRWEWLTKYWGCRIPAIHLVVDYTRLTQRKLEMTAAGLEIYNREMFRHHTRRCPTDYLLFNNNGSLSAAAESLHTILQRSLLSARSKRTANSQTSS